MDDSEVGAVQPNSHALPLLLEHCALQLADWKLSHRAISAAEAGELVGTARSTDRLLCVAQADLAAPYARRTLQRYREMCAALAHHGIQVAIDDFAGSNCINPLSLARVSSEHRLLVANAGYAIVPPAVSASEVATAFSGEGAKDVQAQLRSLFEVAADTITFHLIEAVVPSKCTYPSASRFSA